jgi:hypothetical protein
VAPGAARVSRETSRPRSRSALRRDRCGTQLIPHRRTRPVPERPPGRPAARWSRGSSVRSSWDPLAGLSWSTPAERPARPPAARPRIPRPPASDASASAASAGFCRWRSACTTASLPPGSRGHGRPEGGRGPIPATGRAANEPRQIGGLNGAPRAGDIGTARGEATSGDGGASPGLATDSPTRPLRGHGFRSWAHRARRRPPGSAPSRREPEVRRTRLGLPQAPPRRFHVQPGGAGRTPTQPLFVPGHAPRPRRSRGFPSWPQPAQEAATRIRSRPARTGSRPYPRATPRPRPTRANGDVWHRAAYGDPRRRRGPSPDPDVRLRLAPRSCRPLARQPCATRTRPPPVDAAGQETAPGSATRPRGPRVRRTRLGPHRRPTPVSRAARRGRADAHPAPTPTGPLVAPSRHSHGFRSCSGAQEVAGPDPLPSGADRGVRVRATVHRRTHHAVHVQRGGAGRMSARPLLVFPLRSFLDYGSRSDHRDDPLEVVHRGELDEDAALAPTDVDADAGVEVVGQALG